MKSEISISPSAVLRPGAPLGLPADTIATFCFVIVILLLVAAEALAQSTSVSSQDLFVSGVDGYASYRIPALISTRSGALVAFCEGRKAGKADSGDIDLIYKRSTDGGRSWSKSRVIWDDGPNTCGNPCAVLDEPSGAIFLLMTHNLGGDTEKAIQNKTAKSTRTVWISRSMDEGQTWPRPAEITSSVKDSAWGWYATGPGIGIQIKHGDLAGRLVIPCDHTSASVMNSHIIYSDDHGVSWKIGGVVGPKMNECQVVELADGKGSLLLDMRSYLGEHRRAQSISLDGGLTWSTPQSHPDLIEPVCQASILRQTWPGPNSDSRLLFLNPASDKRRNLTLRLSRDEGKSWPVAKVLHPGPAAYSSLTLLKTGEIACLYESGESDPYERIRFSAFALE